MNLLFKVFENDDRNNDAPIDVSTSRRNPDYSAIQLNVIALTAVMNAWRKAQRLDQAWWVFVLMTEHKNCRQWGIRPNHIAPMLLGHFAHLREQSTYTNNDGGKSLALATLCCAVSGLKMIVPKECKDRLASNTRVVPASALWISFGHRCCCLVSSSPSSPSLSRELAVSTTKSKIASSNGQLTMFTGTLLRIPSPQRGRAQSSERCKRPLLL
jgi:hypothetical protein